MTLKRVNIHTQIRNLTKMITRFDNGCCSVLIIIWMVIFVLRYLFFFSYVFSELKSVGNREAKEESKYKIGILQPSSGKIIKLMPLLVVLYYCIFEKKKKKKNKNPKLTFKVRGDDGNGT